MSMCSSCGVGLLGMSSRWSQVTACSWAVRLRSINLSNISRLGFVILWHGFWWPCCFCWSWWCREGDPEDSLGRLLEVHPNLGPICRVEGGLWIWECEEYGALCHPPIQGWQAEVDCLSADLHLPGCLAVPCGGWHGLYGPALEELLSKGFGPRDNAREIDFGVWMVPLQRPQDDSWDEERGRILGPYLQLHQGWAPQCGLPRHAGLPQGHLGPPGI